MEAKKILIVDDDVQFLNMLREVLEEEEYRPAIAESGPSALKLLADEPFDLLICDIRMPEMDGFEVLKRVKRDHPHTPVIMMTGYSDDYDISDALVLGADDYITKPFDIDKVLIAVDSALSESEEE